MSNKKDNSIWDEEINEKYVNDQRERDVFGILKNLSLYMKPGNALELGIGAGIESAFLIQKGWNVKGIDVIKNNKERVLERIDKDKQSNFEFEQTKFEWVNLPKNHFDLIIGFNSLHFCEKKEFYKFFDKIKASLKPGGILLCNLLGENDEWNKMKRSYVFLTKEKVIKMLENEFYINENSVEEKEFSGPKADGTIKYWHIFLIKAIKKKK